MLWRMSRPPRRPAARPRYGLARVLSKLGVASRSQAEAWVRQGRVGVDGRIVTDPEHPLSLGQGRLSLDGRPLGRGEAVYLALNKPRGLVTTRSDERGRDTIYACLDGAGLPWVAPVGRLDRASEGLLLLSNDPEWAAAVSDPAQGPAKCYHVQLRPPPVAEALAAMLEGIEHEGEMLRAHSARILRQGERSAWLEVVLGQGRNRQIRRMCQALGLEVQRLVRVAIGELELGSLGKGEWRRLAPDEVLALAPPGRLASAGPAPSKPSLSR